MYLDPQDLDRYFNLIKYVALQVSLIVLLVLKLCQIIKKEWRANFSQRSRNSRGDFPESPISRVKFLPRLQNLPVGEARGARRPACRLVVPQQERCANGVIRRVLRSPRRAEARIPSPAPLLQTKTCHPAKLGNSEPFFSNECRSSMTPDVSVPCRKALLLLSGTRREGNLPSIRHQNQAVLRCCEVAQNAEKLDGERVLSH